jgi:hypothetical protein
VHSTYAIHGAGDPANNLLTVIQGDDSTVQAASLEIDVNAAGVADETNPAKKALAIDDGTQPSFVLAHDVGKVTVDPASTTIPVTIGIGKLTNTTVQNVAYNPTEGGKDPGNTLRLLGSAAADAFNVDAVAIPNIAPLPSLHYADPHSQERLVMDPRPVATEVSIRYGDDGTMGQFTLFGMQAADHLALNGGAGRDSYTLTLNVGTYFTTDIEDTDQTPASGTPAAGPDLTISGVEGIPYERQDKLTLTDNSAQFAFHVARTPNTLGYSDGITSVQQFLAFYTNGNTDGLFPQISAPVFYSPAVNWGSGIKNVAIYSHGTFAQVDVNRPSVGADVTLTMDPTRVGNLALSQMAAYADRYPEASKVDHPLELLDPRPRVDIDANAGNFTFDDRVGGSTINVHANKGTFTLAGTSTSPTASAVVAADVAAGASLTDTVNILANSGTVNLDRNGSAPPDQINLGTNGSLAGVQGIMSLQSGGPVAVKIDDSQDTAAGVAWTLGPGGVIGPTFGFQFPIASDPALSTLASLTLNVNAGSSVHVTGIPAVLPPGSVIVNGADVNNTLQGPDQSSTWQISGPDSGTLDDPLIYTGFNNLTGGAGADTFTIGDKGTVSGTLDGGAGIDTLDYSAFTGTVQVNLPAHSATGIAGQVNNVEKATPDVSLTSPGNQPNTEGDVISLPITASSRSGNPLTYSVTGLPPDLTFDSASHTILGTLAAADVSAMPYTVLVTVSDSNDSRTVTFSWTVAPAIVVTNPNPQSTPDGNPATLTIQATDARGTIQTYQDNGTLPPGLKIDNSGQITGTVNAGVFGVTTYPVTITVSDGIHTGTVSFPWTVFPRFSLTIVAGDNQSATVNTAYATSLQVRLTGPGGRPLANVFPIIFQAPRDTTVAGGLFTGNPGGPAPFFLTGTDANGIATAPIAANGVAGSFQVFVNADQVAGANPVFFNLTNLAAVVPAVQLTAPPFVLATQSATYSLSATVPASVTQPTYRIDWGDGTPGAPDIQLIPVPGGNGGAFSLVHVYTQPATFQPGAQLVDGSGTVVTGTSLSLGIAPVNAANVQTLLLGTPGNSAAFAAYIDAQLQNILAAVNNQVISGAIDVILSNILTPVFAEARIHPSGHFSLHLIGNPGATIVGHSPALEVDSGNVTLDGLDLTTDTNAPVILVTGGSLTVRNCTITATGSSPAAIEVTGGSVDLGTAADPGNNVLDSDGPGNLIRDTSGSDISAVGDTFEIAGVPLTSNYRIADQVLDGRDAGGSGLVTFVPGNLYVTAQSGSIQPAIDAAPAGTTIHVESAVYPSYDTHGKPLTILFTTTIDPGSYTGTYTVLGQGSFSGPTTLELAPGVYTVDDGALNGGSSFAFGVDALGNVTSLDPLTAVGGLGTLSFRTAAVTVDPGAFAAAYTLSGFGATPFTGPQTVNLIAGLYWNLSSAAGASFTFQLDGDGNVVAVNSNAATGDGKKLSVATVLVTVDPGSYTGPYTVGGTTVVGGPAVIPVIVDQTTPVSVAGQNGTITADDNGVTPGTLAFTVSGQAYTLHFGANRAPTASAGGPYTLAEGGTLTLDASASSDPDGDPLSYSWDLNGDGVFGDAVGASPTLTWAQLNALGIDDGPGASLILVQVDDGHGHVVTSLGGILTITNTPPTASVSVPASVAFGESVTASPSAADPSPVDQAAGFAYSIDWGDGSPVQQLAAAPGNDAGIAVSHHFPAPGSYKVQVTATDKDGGISSPAVQTVAVTAATDTVGVTASPAPSTFGQLVTFTAGVTANALNVGIPTGTVTFYDGSTSLGTVHLINGSAMLSTAALVAGTHTITAVYSGDSLFQGSTGTLSGGQTVAPAAPLVNVTAAGGTYNGSAFPATGTVTGVDGQPGSTLEGVGLTFDYQELEANGNVTADLGATAPTAGGTYRVTARFPGSADYSAAAASVGFTIARANAIIAVTPYSVPYDGTAHTATGTATGIEASNPVDLGSLLHLAATTHTHAGDYPSDTWTFDGNSNYNPASVAVHDNIAPYAFRFTIGNDHQTAGSPADLAHDLGTTVNTGVNGENLAITYGSSGDTASAGVGTYPITGTLGNGTGLTSDYSVTLHDGTLSVTSAGTPTQLAFTTAPTSTFAGFNLDSPGGVGVSVEDSSGQVVSGDSSTVSIAIASGPTGGAFIAGSVTSVAASNGVATFTHLAFNLSGTYTLRASDGSLTAASTTVVIQPNTGILLLDPSGEALSLSGNAALTLTNYGALFVDSSNSAALSASGGASVTASEIDLVGGLSATGNAAVQGVLNRGVTALADPLANLSAPAKPSAPSGNTSSTLNPGTYTGGITVSGSNSVTLQPGIYYLDGGGLTVSGNAKLTGTGVLIYLAGTGLTSVNISGNASVTLTPPTSGTYQGIALFQDRGSSASITISGNGVFNATGTVYAAGAKVTLSGNDDTDNPAHSSLGSQWIVRDLALSGNAHFSVAADANNRSQDPNAFKVAGGRVTPASGVAALTPAEVKETLDEALRLWQAAGQDRGTLQALGRSTVTIKPLPAPYLGLAAPGTIYLDSTAEGYGWFADSTPTAHPPAGRIDLLTVVEHELGHLFGLMDGNGTPLMAATLHPGVRILADAADLLAPHTTLAFSPDLLGERRALGKAPTRAATPSGRTTEVDLNALALERFLMEWSSIANFLSRRAHSG